jgi:inhibitor of KinA sporulation pathway (predicted exonuclease)
VILDKNPLKVPTQDIKDIQVMQTIKEGKAVYLKDAQTLSVAPEIQEENHAMHAQKPPTKYSKEDLVTLRRLEQSAIR